MQKEYRKMLDRQFEPISILHQTLQPHSSSVMAHDFYEFIFFKKGKGIHRNHNADNIFSVGDLFFIKPNEQHSFLLDEETEVYIVRFSQCARLILKELVDSSNGRAVSLSKAQSPLNPKVHVPDSEQKPVLAILDLLLQLYEAGSQNESLCYYQILCLIAIVERNLSYPPFKEPSPSEKKDLTAILSHIHKHLHEPEMLTLGYIAGKFNISINTLGTYFKKETGSSVKQYIDQCRMHVIEKKVIEGQKSFSEIAYQFGFTDESHFSKYFRKYYGISPTVYRQREVEKGDT